MKRRQQSRRALGSEALLTVMAADDAVFDALWQQVEAFEKRFSRFLPDSELSRFNAQAGRKVKVSQPFRDLLLTCREYGEATGGLFNPFILPSLQRAGYVGSWPTPQTFEARQDYRARQGVVPVSELAIFDQEARIPKSSALDFGGIGKGYLLDQLSAYLLDRGYCNYWLSLGGDIICNGSDLDEQPWAVRIQHATEPERSVGTLTNDAGERLAIATSGITKRQGTASRQHWHHIIDPRSGQPTETDVLTATVAAPLAVQADIYAKCLVILGSDAAQHFIAGHAITDVYLQDRDGRVHHHEAARRLE